MLPNPKLIYSTIKCVWAPALRQAEARPEAAVPCRGPRYRRQRVITHT